MTPAVADAKSAEDGSTKLGPAPLDLLTTSSIVDQELNRHGMARYQWMIWGICGSGFLLDMMWSQGLAFTSSSIQHEFGFSDKELGNMSSAFLAGFAAGAFVWGVLIDVVGRRVAFLGTSLISGIFGMCIGGMSSYSGLLVMLAFTGFGVGGNIPVDSTITVEYLPKDRFYLLTALSIFQPLGAAVCTLISFALVPRYSCSVTSQSCHLTGGLVPCCSKGDNMGWRYQFFTMSSLTLGVFIVRFFIFPFYESPKYLLSKGNDQGAVEVIRKIATFNGRSCDLTVESLYQQADEIPTTNRRGFSQRLIGEISRLRPLFRSWRMIRVTVLIWLTWIFVYLGVTVVDVFLPIILLRKNSAINVSLKQTYIDYLVIYPPGVAAAILSVLMVRAPVIGRKWTLVSSSVTMGMSLMLYSLVATQASHIGFNVLENFCQCLFTAALYGWTPEAFPVEVRGTATGLASFFGSLFAISGPLIAAQLFGSADGSNAVLYMGGSCIFICTVFLLSIPTKDMVAPR